MKQQQIYTPTLMTMDRKALRVVIVGGSIAGLSLAHCLARADIDYVVLEKRCELAPQEGASIGIMPNGARILQQLGLYDALEELVHPLEEAHVTYPDGFHYSSQYPRLLCERFGYPLAFLDRQQVLALLADTLPHQDRIHTNTTVVRVDDQGGDLPLRVHCRDGSIYEGDLVVGADGVHSVVRGEMWHRAGISAHQEQQRMRVQYACIFGISSAVPNIRAGQQITGYSHGRSILSVVGKHGRIYWFLFHRLPHNHHYGNAPRFSREDAIQHCESLARNPYWRSTTFGDLWERRVMFNMTAVDEYVLEQWHSGRIVCIGDSVHKIAPHTGQGANCAIEDAAVLASALAQLVQLPSRKTPPSLAEWEGMLTAVTQLRRQRMLQVAHAASMAMRLHALNGFFLRILARYYLPYTGDMPADRASKGIAEAPLLGFLPVPERSGPGWVLFGSESKTCSPVVLSIVLVVVGLGFFWITLR